MITTQVGNDCNVYRLKLNVSGSWAYLEDLINYADAEEQAYELLTAALDLLSDDHPAHETIKKAIAQVG